MDVVVDDKVVEEVNKKFAREYNNLFYIFFCTVKNVGGDGNGSCCGRGGQQGDGGGQQEVSQGVQ